jgi:hypothetical protein
MSMEYHTRDRMLINVVGSGDHIEFTLEDVAPLRPLQKSNGANGSSILGGFSYQKPLQV